MGVSTLLSRRDVPILGQPVETLGWTVIAHIRCNCEKPATVQLMLMHSHEGLTAGRARCPSCGTPMNLHAIAVNANGALEFQVARGELAASES